MTGRAASTPNPLHSDHINYLIFRYLQEHGHENTATAFHRDWHRPREFRDPEDFPFAPAVARHALVSVVQDGLCFDELQARKLKGGRRFRWSGLSAREREERQEEDLGRQSERERDGERAESVLENGNGNANGNGARPGGSGTAKRRGRPSMAVATTAAAAAATAQDMRAPDDYPTPAPKRRRRSEGGEGVQINGNAMDVDIPTPPGADGGEGAGEDGGEVASPAATASEAEISMLEAAERYDSMDVATQTTTTTVKTGPKTKTMYFHLDKPGASILHAAFNPDPDPSRIGALLAVGESLCRFYSVPDRVGDDPSDTTTTNLQAQHFDDPTLCPANATVTAAAWRPDGRCAAFAIDSMRELPDGRQVPYHMLLEHDLVEGSRVFGTAPCPLQPAGVVLKLSYSPDGKLLLVFRTNVSSSLVMVYDMDSGDPLDEPIALRRFPHAILDTCWLKLPMEHTRGRVVLCGDGGYTGFLSVLPVDVSAEELARLDRLTGLSIRHGDGFGFSDWGDHLSGRRPFDFGVDEDDNFNKVAHDAHHGFIALVDNARKQLCLRLPDFLFPFLNQRKRKHLHNNEFNRSPPFRFRGQLTALAFQPCPSSPFAGTFQPEGTTGSSLLAATFDTGSCFLFKVHFQNVAFGSESSRWGPWYLGSEIFPAQRIDLDLPYRSPALALAWSPSGRHLAVAGAEVVRIWDVQTLGLEEEALLQEEKMRRAGGSRAERQALITWWRQSTTVRRDGDGRNGGGPLEEAQRVHDDDVNGGDGDEEEKVMMEPSVSWSADGQALAVATEREIAVIRILPASADDADADVDADGEDDDLMT